MHEDENWIGPVQDCAHWQGLVLMVLSELPVSLINLCISERKWQNKQLIYINMLFVMICRVTVMKDKVTRKSKGVAFVLFLNREDAQSCAKAVNGRQVSTGLCS
jgi:RNA recognition motif-containing protein